MTVSVIHTTIMKNSEESMEIVVVLMAEVPGEVTTFAGAIIEEVYAFSQTRAASALHQRACMAPDSAAISMGVLVSLMDRSVHGQHRFLLYHSVPPFRLIRASLISKVTVSARSLLRLGLDRF